MYILREPLESGEVQVSIYAPHPELAEQASVFVQYDVHLPARSSCSIFENLYCGFKHKMLFGLMLKQKRLCSFSGRAQPGQK